MTTRYQKSQIEDVAQILRDAMLETIDDGKMASRYMDDTTIENITYDFETLFAADNPPRCVNCGEPATTTGGGSCHYVPQLGEHNFEGGFNREEFLTACGLESEG